MNGVRKAYGQGRVADGGPRVLKPVSHAFPVVSDTSDKVGDNVAGCPDGRASKPRLARCTTLDLRELLRPNRRTAPAAVRPQPPAVVQPWAVRRSAGYRCAGFTIAARCVDEPVEIVGRFGLAPSKRRQAGGEFAVVSLTAMPWELRHPRQLCRTGKSRWYASTAVNGCCRRLEWFWVEVEQGCSL